MNTALNKCRVCLLSPILSRPSKTFTLRLPSRLKTFTERAGVVRLLNREGAPLLPGLFCPESRCSQEFYDNCNRALAEVGLMVVNLCVKNHRRILSRIRKSFGGQIVLSTDDDGNTVVFACKGAVALVERRGRKFIPNEA